MQNKSAVDAIGNKNKEQLERSASMVIGAKVT